jgi:hypothetical protein
MRAAHINELRTALDLARSALSLTSTTYTDPTLTALSTLMTTSHINELRNGVQ